MNGCLVHDGATSRRSDDGYVGTPQAALIRRKLLTIGVGRIDYIQSRLRTEPYGRLFRIRENRGDTASCATASESSEKQCSSSVVGYDHGRGPYQFGSPQGLVDRVSCGGFVSEDQPRINEVAIGHHVLGFGSEVLNLAIHRLAS